MSNLSNSQSIGTLMRAVVEEQDIDRALENFIRHVVHLFKADYGSIYRLYLDRSAYICQIAYHPRTDEIVKSPASSLHVNEVAANKPTSASLLARSIVSRSVVLGYRGSLRVPIVRGSTCLGVLCLDAENRQLANIDENYLELVRSLVLILFERQTNVWLQQAVHAPVDFGQPFEAFLEDMLLRIAEATRMPFIQVHEWQEDEKRLRCVAAYGSMADRMHGVDLESVDAFGPFAAAVADSKTIVECRTIVGDQASTESWRGFHKIQSLVIVPLRVGAQVFGTVTFGAYWPFDYSPMEVSGFENIASSIGATILNSRNAQQLRNISEADARIGFAISGLEVAQSARHQVRGTVEDCIASLATMHTYIKRQNLAELDKLVQKLGDRLTSIDQALNRIKEASRTPEERLDLVCLPEVWAEARALVVAKLEAEHIETRIAHVGKEKDSQIEIFPDLLRHAFLHLLLNSIDAFKNEGSPIVRLLYTSIRRVAPPMSRFVILIMPLALTPRNLSNGRRQIQLRTLKRLFLKRALPQKQMDQDMACIWFARYLPGIMAGLNSRTIAAELLLI